MAGKVWRWVSLAMLAVFLLLALNRAALGSGIDPPLGPACPPGHDDEQSEPCDR